MGWENVCLVGNAGTGKTHLGIALGIAACRAGKRVCFYAAASLANELIAAQQEGSLHRQQRTCRRRDLIVLEELGYIPFSATDSQPLFKFCSERYERGSLLITSNLEFARWTEVFGDEKLTAALLDLLTHRAHILPMNGESREHAPAAKLAGRRGPGGATLRLALAARVVKQSMSTVGNFSVDMNGEGCLVGITRKHNKDLRLGGAEPNQVRKAALSIVV